MSQFGKTKLVKKLHFDKSAKEKLLSGYMSNSITILSMGVGISFGDLLCV